MTRVKTGGKEELDTCGGGGGGEAEVGCRLSRPYPPTLLVSPTFWPQDVLQPMGSQQG